MSHQQAVARVAVPHHVVYRVGLGRDQVDYRPQFVEVAVAGMGPQGDPFVGGAAQPDVLRHEVVHVPDINRLAGIVGTAQADQNVVSSLAGGDAIVEIQPSGFCPVQCDRDEGPEIVGVVLVDRTLDLPA